MKLLILDTATKKSFISLFDGAQFFSSPLQEGAPLSQTIHPLLDELLQKAQLSLSSLTGIACNQGPGSFTGVRVGASLAKAFAYALQIPIFSFNTFTLLKKREGHTPILDAKSKGVYALKKGQISLLTTLEDPCLVSPDAFPLEKKFGRKVVEEDYDLSLLLPYLSTQKPLAAHEFHPLFLDQNPQIL